MMDFFLSDAIYIFYVDLSELARDISKEIPRSVHIKCIMDKTMKVYLVTDNESAWCHQCVL